MLDTTKHHKIGNYTCDGFSLLSSPFVVATCHVQKRKKLLVVRLPFRRFWEAGLAEVSLQSAAVPGTNGVSLLLLRYNRDIGVNYQSCNTKLALSQLVGS